jgi:hypothetical protein
MAHPEKEIDMTTESHSDFLAMVRAADDTLLADLNEIALLAEHIDPIYADRGAMVRAEMRRRFLASEA